MNKRQLQYEKSLDRLFRFLEYHLGEGPMPPSGEIHQEIEFLRGLADIPVEIHDLRNDAERAGAASAVMVCEEYNRYDRPAPDTIQIVIIPADMDSPKEINKLISSAPKKW